MATNDYAHNRSLIIGVTTAVLILAVISYALRLYARRISGARIWLDDYTIGIGLLLSFVPYVCNYVGLQYGFGKHAVDVDAEDVETYLKYVYAQQMAWVWMMPTIKVAILLFYYRLFPHEMFRKIIYGVGAFVLLCLVSTFFGFLFQCVPIRSFWQQQLEHHCFMQDPFYLAVAVLSLVSDVVILVMPMPLVWALHTSKQRKIGLSLVFLLGGCVCIISICRLFSLLQTNLDDITYTNIPPGLWSTAEGGIGVMSANLPSLRPLFSCMAAKGSSRPSVHPSDGFDTDQAAGLRCFQSKSKGFERVEPAHDRPVTNQSAAKKPARAVLDGLDEGAEIPMQRITVTTFIKQEVGPENMA
ncbi:hypothetical protein MMC17_002383 [Xylographa soralifera]|nr:hypothetical protein [Xylographa soralifera]